MEIQSDIPIPVTRAGRQPVHPWRQLQVGDSFFVSGKHITSISPQATRAGRCLGINLTCRSVTEGGVTGVRVWRIS